MLSIRLFFNKALYVQSYISVGLVVLTALLLFIGKRFGKWLEYIVIGYLIAILLIIFLNLVQFGPDLDIYDSFYGGYTVALIQRLVGYQVVKTHSMIALHLISLIVRLTVLKYHQPSVIMMVIAMEACTLWLGFKSEKGERTIFDTIYKSEKQLLNFKNFLTEHLPNQMAIFAEDFSSKYFVNNAFLEKLSCDNNDYQVKAALETLIIERGTIDKNIALFESIGCSGLNTQPLNLATVMEHINTNKSLLGEKKKITFQVRREKDFEKPPTPQKPYTPIISPLDESTAKKGQQQQSLDELLSVPRKWSFFKGASIQKMRNRLIVRNRRNELSPRREEIDSLNEPVSPSFSPPPSPSKRPDSQNTFFNLSGLSSSQIQIRKNSHIDVKDDATVVESSHNQIETRDRYYQVRIFLLTWENKPAIALMLNDITQQRTIMELKIADKNKDLVIAMLSHELKTPLHGMLGQIDITKKRVTDPGIQSDLKRCRNSGLLLLNLINSILDMSQAKHNKLKLISSKVHIKELLDELAPLFEPYTTRGIYLDFVIAKDVPRVLTTDRSRLSQILINLLGNAFKFTFSGGVTVKVELEKQFPLRVKFSVQDTGIGIKKADQTKLFKLFGRVEQQDSNLNTNGVGLGLTISNTLAVLMSPSDGKGVSLESEYGKGSTFSFIIECILPRRPTETNLPQISDEEMSIVLQNIDELSFNLREVPILNTNSEHFLKSKTIELLKTPKGERENNKDATGQKVFNSVAKTQETEFLDKKLDNEEQQWCLVVDDNPFNLIVASHIMEERGYIVKTAMNGKEAIQQVIDHEKVGKVFKVVLMDCQMPVMDGYQATKVLRDMMHAKEVSEFPIVALTAANRNEGHELLCMEVGMVGCVSKPLQISELEEILRKCKKKSIYRYTS